MAAATLHCRLVTPRGVLFEGEVTMALICGAEGDFGVLPHHMWLVSDMRPGTITLQQEHKKNHFTITGGIMETRPQEGKTQCLILADDAKK